jgi:hypothetical protein
MTNNNLADISAFKQLQAGQNTKTNMSSMSVFNAFQVIVPTFVKKTDPKIANFKYQDKTEAEKQAKGWRDAILEIKKGENNTVIYTLHANGQRYTITDKSDAEKAHNQAKKSEVVEI